MGLGGAALSWKNESLQSMVTRVQESNAAPPLSGRAVSRTSGSRNIEAVGEAFGFFVFDASARSFAS